jgi:hypothetical protein
MLGSELPGLVFEDKYFEELLVWIGMILHGRG